MTAVRPETRQRSRELLRRLELMDESALADFQEFLRSLPTDELAALRAETAQEGSS
jgi:hypothetical protein